MIVLYHLDGKQYSSSSIVRQELFKTKRIAFGSEPKQKVGEAEDVFLARLKAFWKAFNVDITIYVAPPPTEEETAAQIRQQRNLMLEGTDKYMISDYPITPENLEVLKIYRQALRDVPSQKTFPNDVTWPDAPDFLFPTVEEEEREE